MLHLLLVINEKRCLAGINVCLETCRCLLLLCLVKSNVMLLALSGHGFDTWETLQVRSDLKLEVAMKLNNLEQSELYWEKALDNKMLMAWNADTIVLVFRGTASTTNALADLQAMHTL